MSANGSPPNVASIAATDALAVVHVMPRLKKPQAPTQKDRICT